MDERIEETALQKKHLNWIDVAKGICMLSIIAGHMGQLGDLHWIYVYHVPVFFILSGYTFKEKFLNADYLRNSFKRLLIPYFITCLFVVVFDPVKEFLLSGTSSVYDLTKIIFGDVKDAVFASGASNYILGIDAGSHMGAIWFLPALFFARIFTQIILNIKPWNRRLLAGLGMLIFSVVMCRLKLQLPFSMLSGICAAFYVLAGMFIRESRIFEKLRMRHYITAFVAILLIYGYGVLSGTSDIIGVGIASSRFPDPFISVIATLCASILVIRVSMSAEKLKFLSWIGKNSLMVLCAHLFTLKIVQDFILEYIFPRFPFEPVRGTTVYTIILAAFHVLICSIVVIVSKPLPSRWQERVRAGYQALEANTVKWGGCRGRSLLSECSFGIDRTLSVSEAILAVLVISMSLDLYGTLRTMLNTFVFAALALSMLGVVLGSRGIFLPCSLDLSLFMVAFFFAGHMFFEYDVVGWYIKRPWLYFIAAAAEAYIIYSSTINYANREYGIWAYCVLGGIAGTFILFNTAHFICSRITISVEKVAFAVSRCAFFIMLSSALLQPFLNETISDLVGLDQKGMANGLICCMMELVVGVTVGTLYNTSFNPPSRRKDIA